MGADELLDALLAQDDAACMGMPSGQRVQMAVDEAHAGYVADKTRNLVKRANLGCPQADVRRIDYAEERGPGRVLIGELATCGFATRGQDVVLFGPAGTGNYAGLPIMRRNGAAPQADGLEPPCSPA